MGKAIDAVHRPAKTRKGKKILESRKPKLIESAKHALILKGCRTGIQMNAILGDIHLMKRPLVSYLRERHQYVHPFEDASDIKYLCSKNQASLFMMGSHSKKRPNRLVLGRTYEGDVLDMSELLVTDYKSIGEFLQEAQKAGNPIVPPEGNYKPLLLFQGAAFEESPKMKGLKSQLMDFFRGERPPLMCVDAFETALVFTAFDTVDGKPSLNMSRYRITLLKNSANPKIPSVKLREMGPRLGFSLDRAVEPSTELWSLATKQAKEAVKQLKAKDNSQTERKKRKNVVTDVLGREKGTIHINKQDFSSLHTPHF